MTLLGIDPGLAATGWGVVTAGRRLERRSASLGDYRCLAHGVVRTRREQELGDRILAIHQAIEALLTEHRPATLVLERLYRLRDGSTGLVVGQAMGAIRLAAAEQGVAVVEYGPTQVKLALVGNGLADKHQVQFMVQKLLGLDELPRPDHAADALALCICHLHSSGARRAAQVAHRGVGGPAPVAQRVAAALAADQARRAAVLTADAPSPPAGRARAGRKGGGR